MSKENYHKNFWTKNCNKIVKLQPHRKLRFSTTMKAPGQTYWSNFVIEAHSRLVECHLIEGFPMQRRTRKKRKGEKSDECEADNWTGRRWKNSFMGEHKPYSGTGTSIVSQKLADRPVVRTEARLPLKGWNLGARHNFAKRETLVARSQVCRACRVFRAWNNGT